MPNPPWPGIWPAGPAVGVLVAILSAMAAPGAEPQATGALFQAQLDAGEFAPALALAQGLSDAQQRDAWLAQLAEAQAGAGARTAALRSAAAIYDDRARAGALSRVAAQPLGGRGGGTQADFDPLIELITSTIAPETWEEVGGVGAIAPFPTGVYVDSQGVLQRVLQRDSSGCLAELRSAKAVRARHRNVRRPSSLRMVSLPRLEKHVQLLLAAGREPDEAMQVLAGLQRIRYVFVYPEAGDLVLAGPAGDWRIDAEDRVVSSESGQPVLRLDDLVVILRHMLGGPDAGFGCAITPTREALARTRAFVKQSSQNPIRPGQRKAWLEQLRSRLGKQEITVRGLDPRTRAARVMVEADYRMKLVGMGLEEGVPGVESYLDSIHVPPGKAPPPMGVLRWWFTLDYQAVLAAEDRRAFEIRGQGVKVLSENELLTAKGERVHTGESEELNRRFARSFTTHFDALCAKYPVYAELRNLFDLALVCALIREEDLPGHVGWHMTCFGDPEAYPVELGAAPRQVDTVINHRIIHRVHVVAGISGGVSCDPASLVAPQAIEVDRYGRLARAASAGAADPRTPDDWWWD